MYRQKKQHMTTETKAGYKRTKLGWIPEEWEVCQLSEIVEPSRPISYGIVQTGPVIENGVKCIRVIDMINNSIDVKKLITTTKKISNSYKRTILKSGDLIIALRGKIGELAIITKELEGSNLTRGVALLSTNKNQNEKFVLQQLSSTKTKKLFVKNLNGSALKEISIGVLRKFPIILPPLPEQKKIADILSTWDKAIETTQTLIKKLQLRKKGLMQQLLTGKKRLPGFSGYWEEVRISDLYDYLKSYGYSRKQLTMDKTESKIYTIHYGDIHGRLKGIGLDLEKQELPSILNSDKVIPSSYIKDGDLVIADASEDISGVGEIIEIDKVHGNKIVGGLHTFVLSNKGMIAQGFGGYLFKEESIRNKIRTIATGASVLGISKSNLSKIEVVIPEKKEQTAIAQVLTKADEEIHQTQKYLEQLQAQKKGLMQQLLTGQKRVKV